MCGLCGKINFDRDEPASAAVVGNMMRIMGHRGPDGEGRFVAGPVALGHRRLSIIDLSTGDQPMSNEDGTVWIVFNGEIYNFVELRRELMALGHRFKSSSDTEVIVHMYEEVGDRCVNRLQGMFAFALWDQRRQRLLLARDRLGIKPMYYTNTGRSLVFASEIKSVIADPSVQREIDLTTVDRFLTYYYAPGDLTLLRGIRKLDPGAYLTVEGSRVTTTRYWDLAFPAPRSSSLEESAQDLAGLLSETVASHMLSDVPVGVLLSGGLDSTGILHFASLHATTPLHSFTIGFSGSNVQDERPYARLAAQRMGSIHHETTLSAESFRDFLPSYVWHMEEPVCEPPAIALHFVARLAHETGVKVLLSGEGGDEAFAGYPEYRNLPALEAMKAGAGRAKGLLGAGFGALRRLGWKRGGHYQALVDRELVDYYFSRTATPETAFNSLKPQLYGAQLLAHCAGTLSDSPTRRLMEAAGELPLLNQLLYVDTKSWLPDKLLVKADKMAMAASVELRVPLLDHHVLEFAASLPTHQKARGWALKRVLKKALESRIPKEILQRRKAGFPVPYAHWMRHELRDYVHDNLLASGSFSSQYFHRKPIEMLLEGFVKGEPHSAEIFSLLTLNLWYEHFYRSTPVQDTDASTFADARAVTADSLREAAA